MKKSGRFVICVVMKSGLGLHVSFQLFLFH